MVRILAVVALVAYARQLRPQRPRGQPKLNVKPDSCGAHAGEERVDERQHLGAKGATAALLHDEGEVAGAGFCHVSDEGDSQSCSRLDAGPWGGRAIRWRDQDL
jgi:hypothetical protein